MTTQQKLEVLKKARAIQEQGWCAFSVGKDRRGRPVNGNDPSAVQRCFIGSVEATVDLRYDDWPSQYFDLLRLTDNLAARIYPNGQPNDGRETPGYATAHLNNKLGEAAALSLFDAAIDALEVTALCEEVEREPKPESVAV